MQSLYHMLCLPQRVNFMLMILSQLHLSLLPLSSFSWSARVEKKRKELPHSSSTLKYFIHLYLSYIHPMRCRWPCLLWFVKQIVATCCFVHLYMCIHVFVSICTLLSSKLGDKGGVESLMSCLTGCIHVSLFLPANTCCSVWERHCDATHTLIGGRKGVKKREDIIPWLPSRERSPSSHRTSMNFDLMLYTGSFNRSTVRKLKELLLQVTSLQHWHKNKSEFLKVSDQIWFNKASGWTQTNWNQFLPWNQFESLFYFAKWSDQCQV